MSNKTTDDTATRGDIDEVLQVLQGIMTQVDERFNRLEEKVDHIESEVVDVKASYDRLLNTIDTFIGRIDGYETEQAARDSQFAKLLAWPRKVSEKTGVPLENL